jgi:hypothetical protein
MELPTIFLIVNSVLIVVTGVVTILMNRDALHRFQETLNDLARTISTHGERLARIEATCAARCSMPVPPAKTMYGGETV